MKFTFFLVLISLQVCNAQTESTLKTEYSEEFNWTIAIPEDFIAVAQDQWGKKRKKSDDAVGEDIRNQEVTIFAYENNKSNIFTAVWQPYDAEICGDYMELNGEANKVMHQIMESHLPGGNFDSITKTQTIGGLEFQRFDITIDFPDVIKMKTIRFYRLFGEKQFSMNITLIDEKIGQKMLDAFSHSTFE